jgi:hypothetical protein
LFQHFLHYPRLTLPAPLSTPEKARESRLSGL